MEETNNGRNKQWKKQEKEEIRPREKASKGRNTNGKKQRKQTRESGRKQRNNKQ